MLLRKTLVALVAAALVLTSLPGCILDPKESVEEPKTPPVEWPDRTGKEDLVEIVKLVYRTEDMDKYAEALLKPDTHDLFEQGYIWYNQNEDVVSGAVDVEFWGYTEEYTLTERLLNNVNDITLEIYPGSWTALETFREEPCEDCWDSLRDYKIDVETSDQMHYIGEYKIRYVIGPDPENPGKYVIYQMEDLRMN